MIRLALLSILLAGCVGMPAPAAQGAPEAEVSRECPPLPKLRAKASRLEARLHTQAIVRMYVACAGGDHDR